MWYKKRKPDFSVNYLRELLSYSDGKLIWKVNISNMKSGSIAGTLREDGYRTVGIDDEIYLEHMIVWFYMTGCWPEQEIDHINRVRYDNRYDNLRLVSRQEQTFNSSKRASNKCGHKGVYWKEKNKKWCAQIQKDGKKYYLGLFNHIEDAVLTYNKKAVELFGVYSGIL